MRKPFQISVEIPSSVACKLEGKEVKCEKGSVIIERHFEVPRTDITISGKEITFSCPKANKKNIAMIKASVSHFKNMIKGLDESFVYKLEICHVHFPMTAKVDGNKIIITNFLGEKTPRFVKILSDVKVEIKGNEITVSGNNIEKTGQTAANIEKATRVSNKDRRVFQDGIFITEKPGGKI